MFLKAVGNPGEGLKRTGILTRNYYEKNVCNGLGCNLQDQQEDDRDIPGRMPVVECG